MSGHVLGIDPGTRKAGFAIVDVDDGRVIELGVETIEALLARAERLVARHDVVTIALGKGTNADALRLALATLGVPVRLVDERETTLKARSLYFADHPPRGWRRLIPLGMQVPPRPIDDYAAVLIARRYLDDVSNRPNVVN